jgi:hypothetical protein
MICCYPQILRKILLGLSQREVAAALEIRSGSAVNNPLKRLSGKRKRSRHLRRQVEEAERKLDDIKNAAKES